MDILPIFVEQKEISDLRRGSAFVVLSLTDNFERILSGIPGLSPRSKKTYIANVKHFIHYIQLNGVQAHTFADFRNELDSLDKSIKTKNAYLTSAKALLREALKYRILPIDITANVPGFKEQRGHKKDGLNMNEVQKVSEAISEIKSAKRRARLQAMFTLFAQEAFRQIEVCRLELQDFNAKDGFILVLGKGRQEKEKHYLMPSTIQAIQKHIELSGIASGYIFAGHNGKQMTTRAIQKAFTDKKNGIFSKAGIDQKTVHGFRHFNITRTLDLNNGDVTMTAQRARLRTIETVMVYNDARVSKATAYKLSDGFLEEAKMD